MRNSFFSRVPKSTPWAFWTRDGKGVNQLLCGSVSEFDRCTTLTCNCWNRTLKTKLRLPHFRGRSFQHCFLMRASSASWSWISGSATTYCFSIFNSFSLVTSIWFMILRKRGCFSSFWYHNPRISNIGNIEMVTNEHWANLVLVMNSACFIKFSKRRPFKNSTAREPPWPSNNPQKGKPFAHQPWIS